MPSSLSARSRSAREAAAIAARSDADGIAAGVWVCAATLGGSERKQDTMSTSDKVQDVISPLPVDTAYFGAALISKRRSMVIRAFVFALSLTGFVIPALWLRAASSDASPLQR